MRTQVACASDTTAIKPDKIPIDAKNRLLIRTLQIPTISDSQLRSRSEAKAKHGLNGDKQIGGPERTPCDESRDGQP